MFRISALMFITIPVWTQVTYARKADRNQPHGHQGILNPYKPGPFTDISLSATDEATLAKGKSVMKQVKKSGGDGTALCIQDVKAPKAAVWNQILDLNAYKGKVPKVKECSNYVSDKSKGIFKTKMILGVMPGYAYESYYDHKFYPEHDSLVWRLDYDKRSDLKDVSGHWHLQANDDDTTRVYYACDIALAGSLPRPIMSYLSSAALQAATAWVKKESEKNPEATSVAESYNVQAAVTSSGAPTNPSATKAGQTSDGLFARPTAKRGWFGRKKTAPAPALGF